MSWYRFKCLCPVCGQGEPIDWYHAQDSCFSSSGWLYINSECLVKCDECYDKRPSFVLGWMFQCVRHRGKYKKPDEIGACAAISYICSNNNIPKSTRQQMINIVNNYNY